MGVGVNFSPFSKSFISVLFNLRFDKLTIWTSVFGLVIDLCVGFGLGTKKYLYFGFGYILFFENWLSGVGKVGLGVSIIGLSLCCNTVWDWLVA